jgi:hypothetical protein
MTSRPALCRTVLSRHGLVVILELLLKATRSRGATIAVTDSTAGQTSIFIRRAGSGSAETVGVGRSTRTNATRVRTIDHPCASGALSSAVTRITMRPVGPRIAVARAANEQVGSRRAGWRRHPLGLG